MHRTNLKGVNFGSSVSVARTVHHQEPCFGEGGYKRGMVSLSHGGGLVSGVPQSLENSTRCKLWEKPQSLKHCVLCLFRSVQVFSVVHDYFELRPIKPRLQMLRQMLNENQYSGEECEEDEEHKGKKV